MSDRRTILEDSRERLLSLMSEADSRTAPALSRELRAVLVELDQLPAEGRKATVDDLKARRAQRQAEAASGVRAADA